MLQSNYYIKSDFLLPLVYFRNWYNLLGAEDFKTDNNGLELNRQTITGEFNTLIKCLVETYENRHIEEKEYFPKIMKAHIDRGAKVLYSEFKYGGEFIINLINSKTNI